MSRARIEVRRVPAKGATKPEEWVVVTCVEGGHLRGSFDSKDAYQAALRCAWAEATLHRCSVEVKP